MSFIAKTTFTTKLGDANDGKITIFANGSAVPSLNTYMVGYSVVDPTGVEIKAMPGIGLFDFDFIGGGVGASQSTLAIPVDTDGKYLKGDYVINIRYQIDTASAITAPVTLTRTYYYAPVVNPGDATGSDVVLTVSASCVTGLIKGIDNTVYTGRTISARTLTLFPPTITGQPTPANTVASGTSGTLTAQTTTLFDNVTWNASLDCSWSSTSAGDFDIDEVVRTINAKEIPVTCQLDYCALANCVEADFNALATETCGTGGFAALSPTQIGNILYKSQLFMLGFLKEQCGDMVAAKKYFDQLKEVSGDCGCGCSDTTSPTPFVAWT